ncbi:MAG: DUF6273 domain-containing protein [Oscillospiraceae bacterium]|nr:DUF6273 domain-containing protein [Oscillospiraceae bacterium]
MKRSVKIILIAGIAVVVALGLALLTWKVILPAVKYGKAGSLEKGGDIASAYEAYDRMDDYRGASDAAKKLQDQVIASRPSEGVKFAGYDWLVLEQRDGKTLLLMKEVLEMRAYHSTLAETDWENCSLRAWLNSAFYQGLPEADRQRIAETALVNGDNAEYGTKAGKDTRDYVFLLSLAEANLYFRDNAARVARMGNSVKSWWLRSSGVEPMVAAIVTGDGSLGYAGTGVNYTNRAVRPAMWVTLPAQPE